MFNLQILVTVMVQTSSCPTWMLIFLLCALLHPTRLIFWEARQLTSLVCLCSLCKSPSTAMTCLSSGMPLIGTRHLVTREQPVLLLCMLHLSMGRSRMLRSYWINPQMNLADIQPLSLTLLLRERPHQVLRPTVPLCYLLGPCRARN